MWTRIVLVALAFAILGCGDAKIGNTVLHTPAEDRAKAEAILKNHGVEKSIGAMLDFGDHWQVTLAEAPTTSTAGGGQSIALPDAYKVFKDGRVEGRENKTLATK